MSHKYYPPKFKEKEFHCPFCNVFAAQHWVELYYQTDMGFTLVRTLMGCGCTHCKKWSFWYEQRMVVPSESPVEPPHPDLPNDCLSDYNEARDIVLRSPRGAAALLRLIIQKLMGHLGESGSNINNDIKSLVSKGLPVLVQKALDVCRVVGNYAVHPGELNIEDTPEIAHELFHLINFIVEDRITRPKEIQALYDALPKNAKDAIDKRDSKS